MSSHAWGQVGQMISFLLIIWMYTKYSNSKTKKENLKDE
jgi:hypothetical protein